MDKTGIVYFAKNVLGCGCDNSVFNIIEKEDRTVLDCGVKLDRKIVIGERLMIYVVNAADIRPEDLRNVIVEGIRERDRKGYNRLRLAIVTPMGSSMAAPYLCSFGAITDKDDRTHIHIVPEENMKRIWKN